MQAESIPHVAFLPTLYPTFTDLLEHFVKETQKPRSPVAEGLRCCPVHGLQHRLHGFYSTRLPDLSLRGGHRPTWQSRSTRTDHRKATGENVAGCERLPRPLRGLAMTSRGRLLFHVTLYESFVRCRERTAGPLQRSNGGMPDKKCPPERFHKKEGSTKFVLPSVRSENGQIPDFC